MISDHEFHQALAANKWKIIVQGYDTGLRSQHWYLRSFDSIFIMFVTENALPEHEFDNIQIDELLAIRAIS